MSDSKNAQPSVSLAPCACGRPVQLYMTSGGARHECASYGVRCFKCGLVADDLPSNCVGGKRAAIREWNRKAGGQSHTAAQQEGGR